MKNILLIIIIGLSFNAYGISNKFDVSIKNSKLDSIPYKKQYSFSLPNIEKATVSFKQTYCHNALCETNLKVNWKTKSIKYSQKIIGENSENEDASYTPITNITGDDNGFIISSSGNRYNSEEYRYHVRYRYSRNTNKFYKAEIWETDSWWNPYMEKLDDYLKQGAFSKANNLIFKHGTTINGGHTYYNRQLFLKFVKASLRESRRAWLLGYPKTSAQFITDLVNKIPVSQNDNNFNKDEDYFISMRNPRILKSWDKGKKLFNVIEATKENHKIIHEIIFYLIEGKEHNLALELSLQAIKFQPNNAENWFYLGKSYQLQGDIKKGKQAFQKFYSIMKQQNKTAGISNEVLKILDDKKELSSRKKIKKQWGNYQKNNPSSFDFKYIGTVGEKTIEMHFSKRYNYHNPSLHYYNSEQGRMAFLEGEKEQNGYTFFKENEKDDYPSMIWLLKHSFGEPITGWRILPTGEPQRVVLSPEAIDSEKLII